MFKLCEGPTCRALIRSKEPLCEACKKVATLEKKILATGAMCPNTDSAASKKDLNSPSSKLPEPGDQTEVDKPMGKRSDAEVIALLRQKKSSKPPPPMMRMKRPSSVSEPVTSRGSLADTSPLEGSSAHDNLSAQERSLVTRKPTADIAQRSDVNDRAGGTAFRACQCGEKHNRCLHDSSGNLDRDLCQQYLSELKIKTAHSGGRYGTGRTLAEMEEIRSAAGHHERVASDENDCSTDSEDDIPLARSSRILNKEKASSAAVGATHDLGPPVNANCLNRDVHGLRRERDSIQARPAEQNGDMHLISGLASPPESAADMHDLNEPLKRPSIDLGPEKAASSPGDTARHVPKYAFVTQEKLAPFSKSPRQRHVSRAIAPIKMDVSLDHDLDRIVSRLAKKGVIFEDESSDDEMQDLPLTDQNAVSLPWQSIAKSSNLYDVAPMLRPNNVKAQAPGVSPDNLANPRRAKKQVWEDAQPQDHVLLYQLRRNRLKFGQHHPHRIVERNASVRTAITTQLRTLPDRDKFDPPLPVKVPMSMDEYMGLPIKPVIEEHGDGLAFRDMDRESDFTRNGARSRRARGLDKRWHFLHE
ncbi:uncharacterized protein AB675_9251 [Cyphellophora attinorum]|uniref:Uncharacterized protein n=1 Tax=Cyphellophora attinorum TaxID=1664694 RepID=A0A0N1H6G1_9EURO|nr:uncharacterized protein AB675_9251 [Phialophora attinorum]KPI41613.1 hypothetical protein AB675_9251 [Phialophora attinorum]